MKKTIMALLIAGAFLTGCTNQNEPTTTSTKVKNFNDYEDKGTYYSENFEGSLYTICKNDMKKRGY